VEHLNDAPLVILETPMSERIDITFAEYVEEAQRAYADLGYDDPLEAWAEDIRAAMGRIRKRLGGVRYDEVVRIFESALSLQRERGDGSGHREWIAYLLREYYDPMYDYQIRKRRERILFRGDEEEVTDYLKTK
jgi:tRNA 2-selenouridine synthase